MITVYKYPLAIEDEITLVLPRGAKILSVQAQRDVPCLWAMVNTAEPRKVHRRFFVRGTGHPMGEAERAKYVGTFQMHGGALVFHLFAEDE